MNQQVFLLVLNHLIDLTDKFRGDLPILIFADRPGSHDSIDIIRTLFNRNAHLVWFMANTSHIVQPLDGTPFATLKKKLRKARDDESLKRAVKGENQNQVVSTVLAQTEREAFKPGVIISGFRDRGIWPFNKDLLLKRGEKEFLNPINTTPAIKEAQHAFNLIIERNNQNKQSSKIQTRAVSGIPEKNKLYTPTQLIQYDDQLKEKKQKEQEEKENKKIIKEQERKEKEEAREKEKKSNEVKKLAMEKSRIEKEKKARKDENDEIRKNILPGDAKRARNQIDYAKFESQGSKKQRKLK